MNVLTKRLAAAGLAACAIALPLVAFNQETAQSTDSSELYLQLELFGQVLDRIREEYVEAPDETELIRAAINGMLTSLDPHSAYISPDSYGDVQEDLSGQFGGLGIEITMENDLVRVVTPYDDSPASRAGILAGDFIIEIEGQDVYGMTLDEAMNMMRGEPGTEVDVVVAREGVDVPIPLTLTRDIISVASVRMSYEREVPIIRVSRFSGQTYAGLEDSIRTIFEDNGGEPPAGIILDLRNNPGGVVDQSVFVADAFLSQGSVVLTRGRTERQNSRYEAHPDEIDALLADVPLIVLINGGSASAAEIVAGALQDHARATLVGTRSFGKGSVQSIIPLGIDGAMRLTTARYYTPNNRSIQALGIIPDIEVLQDVPEELRAAYEILGEAGAAGHLAGEGEEATAGSSVYIPIDKAEDNQLNYAIDLILGTVSDPAFPPSQAVALESAMSGDAPADEAAETPAP